MTGSAGWQFPPVDGGGGTQLPARPLDGSALPSQPGKPLSPARPAGFFFFVLFGFFDFFHVAPLISYHFQFVSKLWKLPPDGTGNISRR